VSRHLASVLFSAAIFVQSFLPFLIQTSVIACALYFSNVSIYKILGFRTGFAEDLSALGYYAMLTGNFLSCVS